MAGYRCRIRGHSATVGEWSFQFSVQAITGQVAALATAVADGAAAMFDGVPSGTNAVKTLYDTATVVDLATVDELSADLRHNVAQASQTINIAGTGTGEAMPAQVAVVCSLDTALPTRAGRGRMYLPAPTVDQVNSGEMASAAQTIFVNGAKNLLDTVNAASLGIFTVVIRHASFLPSEFTTVTGVRVGSVFDTQRRRRDKIKEIYDRLTLA